MPTQPVPPEPNWMLAEELFPERQQKDIRLANFYVAQGAHGMPGHSHIVLIHDLSQELGRALRKIRIVHSWTDNLLTYENDDPELVKKVRAIQTMLEEDLVQVPPSESPL